MSRRPDPNASRQAILEAARDRFSAAGYAGTSMHDIAASAGVTQSLIHHHFGSKDALWAEVRRHAFEQHLAQQRAVLDAVSRDPDQLRPALARYFQSLIHRPDVLRLVAWLELDARSPGRAPSPSGSAPSGPAPPGSAPGSAPEPGSEPAVDLRAELRELHAFGLGVIEALQAQGRVRRDLPARHLLVALLGLVRNWFEERNLVQDESDPKAVAASDAAYLETLWLAIAEGMLAPRAQPDPPRDEIASLGDPAA